MRREPFVQPPPRALADLKLPAPPLRGVVSHVSAAQAHGLPLLGGKHQRSLILPPGFHDRHCEDWIVHRAVLSADDLMLTADGHPVTGIRRTAIDCARTLPLYSGVALLDAALNRELVSRADLEAAAKRARGPGAGALQQAVRLADGRAESEQESVARVALVIAGMPCEPQFALTDGEHQHHFDLGLRWAKLVIDLQSRAHHSKWSAVVRDIGYLQVVNSTPGWRLAWTTPSMVLPLPFQLVTAVAEIVIECPGPRSRALRKRYVTEDGFLDLASMKALIASGSRKRGSTDVK